MSTSETDGKMDIANQGDATVSPLGPLDSDSAVRGKCPRFGIAGWTGPVYDQRGNLIGRVLESGESWVYL